MANVKNRKPLLFPPLISDTARISHDSDSDDDEGHSKNKEVVKVVNFRCSSFLKEKIDTDCFVIDGSANKSDNNFEFEESTKRNSRKKKKTHLNSSKKIVDDKREISDKHGITWNTSEIYDESTKKLLEKSIIRPGFEKILGEGFVPLSAGAAKRMRKIERERTKGVSWFNMPATELTEERRRDLELLQMRDTIDEKARYRKSDHSTLPKFFQVGTIIESKADFYSSRIPKKARKRTIAEELLADIEFQARQKKKFNEIKSLEAIKKKGAFRHSWYPKKKRMRRKNI